MPDINNQNLHDALVALGVWAFFVTIVIGGMFKIPQWIKKIRQGKKEI